MAGELGSNPPLRRQQSLSAAADISSLSLRSRTLCCCLGGGRRGRSLAECEFDEFLRQCTGFFSACAFGSTQKVNYSSGYVDKEDDQDLFPHKTPSRFKVLCRKLKAEARSIRRQNGPTMSGTSRFHYDALSYAMNFDDGTWAQAQDYEGNSVQMRLQSARFSGSIPIPNLPSAIPSES
ncbi:hypothetical protein L7F22_040182 [Adiantum nelumboides]|nr:hypothetical protein [Adiantum nelumboides]